MNKSAVFSGRQISGSMIDTEPASQYNLQPSISPPGTASYYSVQQNDHEHLDNDNLSIFPLFPLSAGTAAESVSAMSVSSEFSAPSTSYYLSLSVVC